MKPLPDCALGWVGELGTAEHVGYTAGEAASYKSSRQCQRSFLAGSGVVRILWRVKKRIPTVACRELGKNLARVEHNSSRSALGP